MASQIPKPPAIMAILMLLFIPTMYLAVEYYVSLAYTPYYSYLEHFTSNLGIPHPFEDPIHNRLSFSPRAQWMRINFVANGCLYMIAHTFLLEATQPLTKGKYAGMRMIVATLYCIGIVLVAMVPGGKQTRIEIWHFIGASICIAGGSLNAILAGIATPAETAGVYRRACIVIGNIGLAGALLIGLGYINDSNGLWQRVAIYPTQAWEYFTALTLVSQLARGTKMLETTSSTNKQTKKMK